jgi:hypothetical protein
MDYKAMTDRIGQFRQAQVPGGGQRPMTMPGAMGGQAQPHNPMGQPMGVPRGPLGALGAYKRFGQ